MRRCPSKGLEVSRVKFKCKSIYLQSLLFMYSIFPAEPSSLTSKEYGRTQDILEIQSMVAGYLQEELDSENCSQESRLLVWGSFTDVFLCFPAACLSHPCPVSRLPWDAGAQRLPLHT